jgi:tripeptide aminopeptidase
MRGLGITPRLVPTGGGTDGNILNLAGIETVQISAGMDEVHTTHEHVAVDYMVQGAELLLACVRA